MPYSITTQDGITIDGIPDEIPTDSPELKTRVAKIRGERGTAPPADGKTSLVREALEPVNALATGFNRGLAGIAGLPIDTAQNIIDLVKAPAGVAYTESTGKAPPEWLQAQDRTNLPGSSAWITNQLRRTEPTKALIDPQNPDYEGGYLQAAGSGLTAIQRPGSMPQLLNQGALGVAGSVGGKMAYDLTGDPSWAVAGSMTPAALQAGAVAATKRAVRGGEEGRLNMQRRTQQLRNAGVGRPTLGLASGNETVGGLENILQSTPGAIKVMREARESAIDGMRRATAGAADAASTRRGAFEAGGSIRRDIRGPFMGRFKGTQQQLYDVLDSYLPADQRVKVAATEEALHALTTPSSGAPNVTGAMVNPRIAAIRENFDADTGAVPARRQPRAGASPAPSAALRAGARALRTNALGVPISESPAWASGAAGDAAGGGGVPGGTVPAQRRGAFSGVGGDVAPDPLLPYGAVKSLRTSVGDDLSNELVSGVPNSQTKRLYAGLTEDMQAAAEAAGAGPQWNRANTHTRAGLERLERLEPFANTTSDEQAFNRLAGTLDRNTSTFQAVKKSVTPQTRSKIAATVIESLGTAAPGQQNASGDVWSPETFLTNWNRLGERGRAELLSGFENAAQVRQEVESVAQAAAMMRQNSKIWANPSGTAANAAARATFGTLPLTMAGATMGMVNPAVPAGLAAGLGLTRAGARFVTDPRVVDSFANRTRFSPATQRGLLLQYGLLPEDSE